MKLLILGATGGTGLEIVRTAVERGHSVTAFVRAPGQLDPFRSRIIIRQGDLLNDDELTQAVQGQDAILSGFGPRLPIAKADEHLWQHFAVAVTGAMQRAGVRRVVVTSTAFLFKNAVIPPAHLVGRLFFPTTVADAAEMERVFVGSGLDWTMVRPPQLTDKPFTGKYRVRVGHLPILGFNISRADVADCIVNAAENDALIRRVVGVSN